VIEGPRIERLARRLREAETPVLARTRDEALWLDVRTLTPDDFDGVIAALVFALD
jgi:seryl-tRNA(Sec) selenium transferase